MCYATLPLGATAPVLEIHGDDGGTVAGAAWSSKDFATAGKVHMVVNSTVGEKDTNNETTEAIKKEDFPEDKFSTVAVINMASSWQPNFMIDRALDEKQQQYKRTLYVRDKKNAAQKGWKLADKSNNIVLFDKTGKVVFSVDGKLSKEEREKLLSTIRESIK
jgi:predicted transcriptional regulator